MKCPHCGETVYISLCVPVNRTRYYQIRHIESGRAKIRTSVDQIGKCVDCGEPSVGRKWRCVKCHKVERSAAYKRCQERRKKAV